MLGSGAFYLACIFLILSSKPNRLARLLLLALAGIQAVCSVLLTPGLSARMNASSGEVCHKSGNAVSYGISLAAPVVVRPRRHRLFLLLCLLSFPHDAVQPAPPGSSLPCAFVVIELPGLRPQAFENEPCDMQLYVSKPPMSVRHSSVNRLMEHADCNSMFLQ